MDTQARLTRSSHDKVIGGVCSGLGHYFGLDPVLVRLLFVALVFAGVSFVLYPVLWLIMPSETSARPALAEGWQDIRQFGSNVKGQVQSVFTQSAGGSAEAQYDPQTGQPVPYGANNRNRALGAALLGVGVIMLASMFGGGNIALAVMLLGGGFYLLRRGS